jgi:hypothetical protein
MPTGVYHRKRYDNLEPPTATPEYRSWSMARNRCRNPKADQYAFYGGRGITFSSVFDDFKAFLFEVGPRPSIDHSIERIDNQCGYEPGNIRWATKTEQCNNRRTNRFITFNGNTLTLAEWGRATGIGWAAIQARLTKGWTVERALTQPKRRW